MAIPVSIPLLDHCAALSDRRQHAKVVYPLSEILLLVLAATIAGADDFVETTLWGAEHLAFLRRFYPYDSGIPSHDTLCDVFAALDPELFKACFLAWINGLRDDDPDIIAVDGKTSRRSHDRKNGQKVLHLVSAFATTNRLVLGQEAVDEKSNEITAIPALLKRIDLEGALVSIDAMGCNPTIAETIIEAKADYLLAVKDNQPTLHADIKSYFDTAPSGEVERSETVGKEHGRLEIRAHSVSHTVDWYASERSYPGAPRFPKLVTNGMSRAGSSAVKKSRPNGDPTSPHAPSRPKPSPLPCEAIGPSKITCTGPSM